MPQTPLHDWLRPHLAALFNEAVAAGFEREAVAAVLEDLMTAAPFDPLADAPAEPSLP